MAGDFDLHQLLAGPVIAMNDAQADAAASFYELFDQFAFEPPGDADGATAPRRLKMISFVAERAVEGRVERREISIPLLQMIPIGGVSIDSATIRFSLAVNAEAPAAARSAAPPPAAAQRAVALKARIAPGAAGPAEAAAGNLQVEIVLKQVDLPAGYLDMIAETQGGMSRPLADDAPPAADEAPLFTASAGKTSPGRATPGGAFNLVLELVPNPRLVGPDGLHIILRPVPKAAFRVVVPAEGRLVVQRGRRSEHVQLAIAARDSRSATSLALDGRAVGPDGVARQLTVTIAIPRAQSGEIER